MKLLAICIPNYNRIDKLERLVRETAKQIVADCLMERVQICISDDCSPTNPINMIEKIKDDFPQVDITYNRHQYNQGMDVNFLHSVMMAVSEYCWIIGNDDVPTEKGIYNATEILQTRKNVDILLTPFDNYDNDNHIRETIYPIKENRERTVNTKIKDQYEEFLLMVSHNSGLFGFLSNVIFKKEKWIKYEDLFVNKMDTLFIQMYMNIQTLNDGATLLYLPNKIIKNYADDETNESVDRICKILFGLDGVVEYFFGGYIKDHLKRTIVDAYISGNVWKLPEESIYKKKLRNVISPKNEIYKKYFIPCAERKSFFAGKNILIYGAGNYGRKVCRELQQYEVNIVGIVDSDVSKKGTLFENMEIMSTSDMLKECEKKEIYVLVANHFGLEQMVDYLQKNKITNIGIIS